MSTKIYYGLKVLNESLFFKELNEYKIKLIDSYSEKELAAIYLRSFFKANNIFETKKVTVSRFDFDQQFASDFEKNKTQFIIGYQNPYDLSLSYFRDAGLVIPYFNQQNMYNDLLNFKSIIEYAYYNNVDRPETVSEKEWSERENAWEKVASDFTGAFGYKNALTIEVNQEKFVPYSPKFQESLNNIFDEVLLKYLKQKVKDNAIEIFTKNSSKDLLENKFDNSISKLVNYNNNLYVENNGEKYAEDLLKDYSVLKNMILS